MCSYMRSSLAPTPLTLFLPGMLSSSEAFAAARCRRRTTALAHRCASGNERRRLRCEPGGSMRESPEERRPLDPTRRLLRTFGVKVTDYDERMAALLERVAGTPGRPEERLALA